MIRAFQSSTFTRPVAHRHPDGQGRLAPRCRADQAPNAALKALGEPPVSKGEKDLEIPGGKIETRCKLAMLKTRENSGLRGRLRA